MTINCNEAERLVSYKNIFQLLEDKNLIRAAGVDIKKVTAGAEDIVSLINSLEKAGLIKEKEFLPVISNYLGLPYVDKIEEGANPDLISQLPLDFARRYHVLPLKRISPEKVLIAVANPLDIYPADELSVLLNAEIKIVVSTREEISRTINRYYHSEADSPEQMLKDLDEDDINIVTVEEGEAEDLLDIANKAPIIRLVNLILFQAVKQRASDIHIEPFEKELKVRYRIDGVLRDVFSPPKRYHAAIISRIKIMCNMNIAEHRLPQDQSAKTKVGNTDINIRVSTIPTQFGERIVMRILDVSSVIFGLEELGIREERLPLVERLINLPHGIILNTGPTGSGKTTTLYAVLNKVNSREKNIITIEDPIEYQLNGIAQINVKPEIGLTFAEGLRSIVRQDPDIIMVGEIRDFDTADIAINASLTGHLVFSTLHTNDAPGAITRLLEMGVEAYLIASSLVAVIAQRLVRLICSHCRQEYKPDKKALEEIGLTEKEIKSAKFYKGEGCDMCLEGYLGRTGIYEIMPINDAVKKLIIEEKPANTIRNLITKQGVLTLRRDGAVKILKGITTVEEVLRVTQRD
jgi:general secretion pathway protein E